MTKKAHKICSDNTSILLSPSYLNYFDMEKQNPYLADSHIIDYFLSIAEKMEARLDKEAYAYVKSIFSEETSLENFENLPMGEENIESITKKQNPKPLSPKA